MNWYQDTGNRNDDNFRAQLSCTACFRDNFPSIYRSMVSFFSPRFALYLSIQFSLFQDSFDVLGQILCTSCLVKSLMFFAFNINILIKLICIYFFCILNYFSVTNICIFELLSWGVNINELSKTVGTERGEIVDPTTKMTIDVTAFCNRNRIIFLRPREISIVTNRAWPFSVADFALCKRQRESRSLLRVSHAAEAERCLSGDLCVLTRSRVSFAFCKPLWMARSRVERFWNLSV